MLCVRKVTFVERAETRSRWTQHLKRQWGQGEMIAVRVHDFQERVLGSTIPMPVTSGEVGHVEGSVSWMNADPDQAAAGDGDAAATSQTMASPPHGGPGETAEVPQQQETEQEKQGQEAKAAAPEPADAPASLPPTAEANVDQTDVASAQQPSVENAAASPVDETTAPATAAAPAPAPGALPSSSSTSLSEPPTGAPPLRVEPVADAPPPPPARMTRRLTFSSCIPINISQAAKGPLFFDIITATGTKLAVTEANVQAALDAAAAGAADGTSQVRHFAIVVTPLKAKLDEKPDNAVYAVLEFSVVTGSMDMDAAISLAASAELNALPTPLDASGVCALSTHTLYFPPLFLNGSGEYIVSNVLCVESRTDSPVELEVGLPEALKKVGVLPSKTATLEHRGQRAFFTFTWSVFDAYVALGADADPSPADHSAAGLHLLIRSGAENKAPVDIAVVGDVPPPAADGLGPYMFYVNHARVANVPCSAIDEAVLANILPISLVTRASV